MELNGNLGNASKCLPDDRMSCLVSILDKKTTSDRVLNDAKHGFSMQTLDVKVITFCHVKQKNNLLNRFSLFTAQFKTNHAKEDTRILVVTRELEWFPQ